VRGGIITRGTRLHIFLETERLILRRFTTDDLDNLVELDSDPEVMRYITGGPPTPRELIELDFLPAWLAYYERGDRYGFWATIEKSTGDFLGWFHFRPPHDSSDPDVAELGYRLNRAAWGKGYATEGSRALIDKGFRELGVRRVVASTYQDNHASRRVMEKCGLTFARSFRISLEELQEMNGFDTGLEDIFDGDDVEYALDRDEWERQQAANRQGA
jgi:RimJ/RimL family protein N-acetyltransferase